MEFKNTCIEINTVHFSGIPLIGWQIRQITIWLVGKFQQRDERRLWGNVLIFDEDIIEKGVNTSFTYIQKK